MAWLLNNSSFAQTSWTDSLSRTIELRISMVRYMCRPSIFLLSSPYTLVFAHSRTLISPLPMRIPPLLSFYPLRCALRPVRRIVVSNDGKQLPGWDSSPTLFLLYHLAVPALSNIPAALQSHHTHRYSTSKISLPPPLHIDPHSRSGYALPAKHRWIIREHSIVCWRIDHVPSFTTVTIPFPKISFPKILTRRRKDTSLRISMLSDGDVRVSQKFSLVGEKTRR